MKPLKKNYSFIGIILSTFISMISRSNLNFTDKKFTVVGQAGSGTSAYFVLGYDVSGQIPDFPGTYSCYDDPASICTVTAQELNIYFSSGQRRVLISNVSEIIYGQFSDL